MVSNAWRKHFGPLRTILTQVTVKNEDSSSEKSCCRNSLYVVTMLLSRCPGNKHAIFFVRGRAQPERTMRNGCASVVPGGVILLVLTCAPPACSDWIENYPSYHSVCVSVCVLVCFSAEGTPTQRSREKWLQTEKHAGCTHSGDAHVRRRDAER